MPLLRLLHRIVNGPVWLTFLMMGVGAGGVALCSYHLFELFQANLGLITTYGLMAILDGGLLQLLQLVGWGYLAMAFYVLFKACLDGLTHRIEHEDGLD